MPRFTNQLAETGSCSGWLAAQLQVKVLTYKQKTKHKLLQRTNWSSILSEYLGRQCKQLNKTFPFSASPIGNETRVHLGPTLVSATIGLQAVNTCSDPGSIPSTATNCSFVQNRLSLKQRKLLDHPGQLPLNLTGPAYF